MYNKMIRDENADFALVSRHEAVQDKFLREVGKALLLSPYTKNELAERLNWDIQRLNSALSGVNTLDFYDATYLAGAIGLQFVAELKYQGEQ